MKNYEDIQFSIVRIKLFIFIQNFFKFMIIFICVFCVFTLICLIEENLYYILIRLLNSITIIIITFILSSSIYIFFNNLKNGFNHYY